MNFITPLLSKNILCSLSVLLIFNLAFSQPTQGLKTDLHREHVKEIVFASAEISWTEPDQSLWKSEFTWVEPIYARIYLEKSMAELYAEKNWDYATVKYEMRLACNGTLLQKRTMKGTDERTTWQMCVVPDPSDSYGWPLRTFLSQNVPKISAGKNEITLSVYLVNSNDNKVSDLISKGSFFLNIDQASLDEMIRRSEEVAATNKANSKVTRLRTYTTEDWDYWEVDNGKFRTYTTEDWDYWEYTLDGQSGKIRTYTSEDWDYWEVDGGKLKIKTYTSEDWDYWEITGSGTDIKVKTYTSEDWDYWEVTGGVSAKIRTYTTEDWDYWEITGNIALLNASVKAAILFIPIFTSSIYIRGIAH